MEKLLEYFLLFDQARTSPNARLELMDLFTDDFTFVLSQKEFQGKLAFGRFLDFVFSNHSALVHKNYDWSFNQSTACYETKWEIEGTTNEARKYSQSGMDFVRLNSTGEITFIENIPNNEKLFELFG